MESSKRSVDSTESTQRFKRSRISDDHGMTSARIDRSSGFNVHPRNFEGNFPYFRQPREIAYFSSDDDRKFLNNRSNLKVYSPPHNANDVAYNLRAGYDTFIRKDETKKEYLDELLRCILLNTDKFQPTASVASQNDKNLNLFTDFICWRGLMTRLLCSPYENRDGWKIGATLFNQTVYLCEFETEQKKEQLANQSEKQEEMSYWGFKFEQYVTRSDEENSKPDTSSPVNNNAQFCSVVRTRLENHSLVYGGEVDCYELEDRKQKYIELKTSREIETPNQDRNFKRFKLIKWWAQSFLIGIAKVISGFRDDDGVVRRLETLKTMDMPKMCKDIHNPWEPSICFNFLNKFLRFVKEAVTENDEKVVYLLTWNPRENIRCVKMPRNSEYCFLPEWYCSKLKGSNKTE